METETLGTSQECQADSIQKAKKVSNYSSQTGTFKNNPTITLNNGDKRVISFGLKKAKAIMAQIEEIKKFVNDNDKGNNGEESNQGQNI